mmetsp:Transcript_2138/g.4798  ORF Transcript_2138/g.4798 Transcript_2138/m.4798 type:complete len:208 (-) Transcript_2138:55-678(-)
MAGAMGQALARGKQGVPGKTQNVKGQGRRCRGSHAHGDHSRSVGVVKEHVSSQVHGFVDGIHKPGSLSRLCAERTQGEGQVCRFRSRVRVADISVEQLLPRLQEHRHSVLARAIRRSGLPPRGDNQTGMRVRRWRDVSKAIQIRRGLGQKRTDRPRKGDGTDGVRGRHGAVRDASETIREVGFRRGPGLCQETRRSDHYENDGVCGD